MYYVILATLINKSHYMVIVAKPLAVDIMELKEN